MRHLSAAVLFALSLGLSACTETVVVRQAPPPPRAELPPRVAPYPGAVWIGGHWRWSGGSYVWVRGHWERHRVGWVWVPHHWEQRGNGWVFVKGHWRPS